MPWPFLHALSCTFFFYYIISLAVFCWNIVISDLAFGLSGMEQIAPIFSEILFYIPLNSRILFLARTSWVRFFRIYKFFCCMESILAVISCSLVISLVSRTSYRWRWGKTVQIFWKRWQPYCLFPKLGTSVTFSWTLI